MKLVLGPQIISSYKRLAYTVWFALAEFVDNSTQGYFNNKSRLDPIYFRTGGKLTVEIETGTDQEGEFLRITDNSIGMSENELKNAVVIGRPPANTRGRSKYGLGLKTAACWFGDLWTVSTKKLGETTAHKITIDVPRVARGHMELPHDVMEAESGEHYTIVEVRKLHREMSGKSVGKVKDYLRSLYRVDIRDHRLDLRWDGTSLAWDSDIRGRLLRRENGRLALKSFRFHIGRKRVSGWAGVLARGSRKEAGFSVLQANRVITGWPDSYRPETLYGSQEGGSNDLVNQRLFGELHLAGFEISHTKDQVLFEGLDQEVLENKLKSALAGLRRVALTYRKDKDERIARVVDARRFAALRRFESEIGSKAIRDLLRRFVAPSPGLIEKSNRSLKNAIVRRFAPDLEAKLDNLTVSLYLVKQMSRDDPYVLIESTESEKSVTVIVNMAHPHWSQLTKAESILNFIRHCTYDGVSEWKAYLLTGKLEPNTVKLLKDKLLRIPMSLLTAPNRG